MTIFDWFIILLIIVQIGCAAALWHFGGPWTVALWAAYVWGPALSAAIVRRLPR